jgi:hypothetical protein
MGLRSETQSASVALELAIPTRLMAYTSTCVCPLHDAFVTSPRMDTAGGYTASTPNRFKDFWRD